MEIHYKNFGFFQKALNAFYPERCPYCNCVVSQGAKACDDCHEDFPDYNYKHPAVGGFETVSPLPYDSRFAEAVKRFKFDDATQFAYQLAIPIAQAVAKEYNNYDFDCISCVPLHPKRYKERGYNQSELLAKELSSMLRIPFENTLIKSRDTKPQHTVDRSKRATNIKGAFRVAKDFNAENKRILLIDDIITTGYTLGECAGTLQSKGCAEIKCATFACAVIKRVEIPHSL